MDGEFRLQMQKPADHVFLVFFIAVKGETVGNCPPCNHLHFCRSKKCLFAVSCLAWLCAKSYKGAIDLDLSAFVGEFVCVCLTYCEVGGGGCLCFKCVCALMQ